MALTHKGRLTQMEHAGTKKEYSVQKQMQERKFPQMQLIRFFARAASAFSEVLCRLSADANLPLNN